MGRFIKAVRRSRLDRVLVSSEVFLEGVDLSFLKEVLGSLDVTFVFYVRRQDEYFESLYVEDVKHGSSDSVEAFYDRWKHNGFNYFARISAFEQAFPRAQIIVREFDPCLFPAGDIARDLLSAMAVRLSESERKRLKEIGLQNQRLSIEQVELLRQFNQLPVSYAEKRAFRRYLSELTQREPGMSKLQPLRVDDRLRREILAVAADSNLRLVSHYLADGKFFNEASIRKCVAHVGRVA